MPDKTTQKAIERLEKLLEMVTDDGASPAGELPPTEHIEALRAAEGRPEAEAVSQAHREGASPPDHAGGGS